MNFARLRLIPAQVVAGLENKQIPFFNYVLTFFAIVIIREFVECYSQTINILDSAYPVWTSTYQNGLSYLVLIVPCSLIVHLATKESIENIIRVFFPCMLLLLISPLFDLLLTKGEGVDILYMQPYMDIDLWKAYLLCGGDFSGVSRGIRIELAVMYGFCFTYFRLKNCSIIKSLFYTWCCYTLTFIWGSSPVWISYVVEWFGYSYRQSFTPLVIMRSFMLLLFVVSVLTAYLANRKIFTAFLKDIRVLRIAYYELLLLFGMSIALSIQFTSLPAVLQNKPEIVINGIFLMIALFFAGLFSLMINNIYDVNIDKISNPERPLVSGSISPALYSALAYTFMAAAFIYAFMVESRAILIIGLVMSSYYVYSATPLRIKRLPVLSKLVVSLNSVAIIVLGFITVQQQTYGFPAALLWIYFIGVTLVSNFIDLKDVAGDKAEGINTMPILFGEKNAKLIIGAAGFFVALSYLFVVDNKLFFPVFAVFGGLFFYFINKRHYEEWKVFLLCNAGLILMTGYFLGKAWLIN